MCLARRGWLRGFAPSLDYRCRGGLASAIKLSPVQVTAHRNQSFPIYCRRSIRRAPTRDAHQWQHKTSKPAIPHPLDTHVADSHWRRASVAAHHIKTGHSTSRRSIPQAPTRDERQWQHTTSKPAIPQLDARFHKCPLQTHVSGSTPHQHQPFPI